MPHASRRTSRRGSARAPEQGLTSPPPGTRRALVVRAHGLWFEVVLDDAPDDPPRIATIRGALKRARRRTDIVAVGDRVWIEELPDNEAVIAFVEPRSRVLARTARNTRDVEQVILANPDQVLFVFAVRDPEPHVRMLDRFIILAELQDLPIRIVVTKLDLVHGDETPDPRARFAEYEHSFPVHFISAVSGEGIDDLRSALNGRFSAVAGPSGVGKSRLLNVLDPENEREVGMISDVTGKGRHTTVGARLHRLDRDTYVADTPGMRALPMHAVPFDRADWAFRELRPYLGMCFYQDCTHLHEPKCAVRLAVDRGDIPRGRYESYAALRGGDELATADDW